MAIIAGVESAVKIHIARGDNLDASDAVGNTPLMLAALRNNHSIFKLLLDAGADPNLTNLGGEDPLSISKAVDAREITSLLELFFANKLKAVSADIAASHSVERPHTSNKVAGVGRNDEVFPRSWIRPEEAANILSLPHSAILNTEPNNERGTEWRETRTPANSSLINFDEDVSTLDVSGWEAEAEPTTNYGDSCALIIASDVQNAIFKHTPIDSSTGWDDLEVFLPKRGWPLAEAFFDEARGRLRSLLLRAIREGSVPSQAVEDLTMEGNQPSNPEALSLMQMVITDLGAEIDERHEYSTSHDDFVVYVDPGETAEEERMVDAALAYLNDLRSRRNEPLAMYQRDFQRGELLTAEEEVALCRQMEQGIDVALDALANSSAGISSIVEDSLLVQSGEKPLNWMSIGVRGYSPATSTADEDSTLTKDNTYDYVVEAAEGSHTESDDGSAADALTDFIANSELLLFGKHLLVTQPSAKLEIRETLGSMGLSGPYLLHLYDSGRISNIERNGEFGRGILEYKVARDRMALANLKLVHSIAKKYLFSGFPLEDLLQEGNVGLLKGVDRFDWRRGFRFSTYATWWIRQAITRSIAEKGRTIRIPVHMLEILNKVDRIREKYFNEFRVEPSVSAIAGILEITPTQVNKILKIVQEPESLDEIIEMHDQGDTARSYSYIFEEYGYVASPETVYKGDLRDAVKDALDSLDAKEAKILRMRFGIEKRSDSTLEEVGAQFGLTRERIRQLEIAALRKLRNPSHAKLFEIFRDPIPSLKKQTKKLGNESSSPKIPSNTDIGSNTLNNAIEIILEEVKAIGGVVSFDQHGVTKSIWLDLSGSQISPSRPLIKKILGAGFKFWPGKGYWL